MSAIQPLASDEPTHLRSWSPDAASFSWRKLATVVLVALLLSAQILFQTGLSEIAESGALLDGWLQLYAEALACGLCMWVCVAAVDRVTPLRGGVAFVSNAIALFAGSIVGVVATLAALQPEGFFPPPIAIAGDALRWSLWGGIVVAAHAEIARRSDATMLLAFEEVERSRAEQRRAEAELHLLRAQIQPHFLFNMLAHVRRLYRVGPRDGADAVERLRGYLREVLSAVRLDESTLAREGDLVRSYLDLVKVSMGERLSFRIDMEPAVGGVRIPALAVLTLVENAIKHGITPCREGGHVRLVALRAGSWVRIEVRDDGAGLRAMSGNGMGLSNTKARLRAACGSSARLTLAPREPRGVVACIEMEAPG